MIIINLITDEDYNPETYGYILYLAGVVNDEFNLHVDPELIIDCIGNDPHFEIKAGQFYEIQLIRATIARDPIPEPAFDIHQIIAKRYDPNFGWFTPLVRM